MTVTELIKQLKRCDHNAKVMIAVRTYTTAHSVAVEEPFSTVDRAYEGCTLYISLPKGMYIGKRKN